MGGAPKYPVTSHSPRPAFVPRFLSRLRVPGQGYGDVRVERILAFSRLLLSVTALAAWVIRPGGTWAHFQAGLVLLPAYVIASLAFLLSLHGQGDALDSFTLWSHITDIGWPALLCLLADDPGRPFYALFFFAIIAAAFRWGFIETMATALVSVACLVLQAPAASYGPAFLRGAVDANLDGPRLVLRCVFLVMAGALLGWLAETEKELRAEIELSNYLLSLARVGERFSVVLRDVLSEVGEIVLGERLSTRSSCSAARGGHFAGRSHLCPSPAFGCLKSLPRAGLQAL